MTTAQRTEPAIPAVESSDDRRAQLVFAGALIVGAVAIMWFGRHTWFLTDGWAMLVERQLSDPGDWLRAQNQVHWVLVPMLVYKGAYALFGLHSYLPYQLPVIMLHLASALMLRRVMIRAAVSPWIATAAAGAFIFYGTGRPNLVWAFQVSLVGSLAFGLMHLLAATHEGPVNRRDAVGLAAGAIGLMCSGLAVTMTIVVGLAVLIMHGWRRAALHTAPLAAMYCLWWFGYASTTEATDFDRGTPSQWIEFIWLGLRSAIRGFGQYPVVGILLAVVLVVGSFLAWRPPWDAVTRRRAALPVALLAGSVVFLWITALGRVAAGRGPLGLFVAGLDGASAPRYMHIVTALVLPALAVAADQFVRRWRWMLAPAIALFLIGVPGNYDELANPTSLLFHRQAHQNDKDLVFAVPRVSASDRVPGWVFAHPGNQVLTVGWLRSAERDGKLPTADPIRPDVELRATAQISMVLGTERPTSCRPADVTSIIDLEQGQSLIFDAPDVPVVAVAYVAPDGTEARPRGFPLILGPSVLATDGPIQVRVLPDPGIVSMSLCS